MQGLIYFFSGRRIAWPGLKRCCDLKHDNLQYVSIPRSSETGTDELMDKPHKRLKEVGRGGGGGGGGEVRGWYWLCSRRSWVVNVHPV